MNFSRRNAGDKCDEKKQSQINLNWWSIEVLRWCGWFSPCGEFFLKKTNILRANRILDASKIRFTTDWKYAQSGYWSPEFQRHQLKHTLWEEGYLLAKKSIPLPETNIALENQWLLSFWDGLFSGATLVLGTVSFLDYHVYVRYIAWIDRTAKKPILFAITHIHVSHTHCLWNMSTYFNLFVQFGVLFLGMFGLQIHKYTLED